MTIPPAIVRFLSVKNILLYSSLMLFGFITACEPEDEQFTSDPSVQLRFSTDSVAFDTLFTSVASVSKRFLVYNDHDKAVNISSIALRSGGSSNYELLINGEQTNTTNNVRLLGKDSLQIIVSVTIDPKDNDLPFLVTDFVDFETNGNAQTVNLVAYGQDAIFVSKGVLECNTTWNAGRPYVLLDTILIDENCQWNIEKGARIYANINAAVLIAGTVDAKGAADERILFTNSRQDKDYIDAPGQWGGIIFAENSHGNHFGYTDIRNAVNGIYIGTPDDNDVADLVLDNCKIENMSGMGIISFTSDIYAYNTLIDNCGVHLAGHFAGGNYRYEHCTFANYSFDFFREDPALLFSDFVEIGDLQLADDISIELTNCIVWGSMSNEILLSNTGGKLFEITATNNIIRTTDEGYPSSNIINEDPMFVDPFNYDYQLDELSPAIDAGLDVGIDTDLDGTVRDDKPDLGAFERVE